jgi:hypothetical protein
LFSARFHGEASFKFGPAQYKKRTVYKLKHATMVEQLKITAMSRHLATSLPEDGLNARMAVLRQNSMQGF